MNVPKVIRRRNRKLLDEVKARPCMISNEECWAEVDPAHIKTRGSGGDDVGINLLSLCRKHHTMQGALGWHKFISLYPKVETLLKEYGWELVNEFGVMKLKRGQE